MRVVSAEEIKFYLLHLSVMRDYLDLEFQDLKKRLSFPYDLECIINDWVSVFQTFFLIYLLSPLCFYFSQFLSSLIYKFLKKFESTTVSIAKVQNHVHVLGSKTTDLYCNIFALSEIVSLVKR